ncbi:MAG TPA: hypothetical protein VMT76_14385 [Puia sp.]|nr:hypothetical protein [Puia sp.]
MTKSKALTIVLLMFVISILVRLPNLNRPVSKHHEFMSALILINVESWQQAGGGSRFHYTPLLNYQNAGDKSPHTLWTDAKGNLWYLSMGPAWYIIPYFVYTLLHLPIEPIYLRILNLFFNFLSVVLLFFFVEQVVPMQIEKNKRYNIVLLSCFLFSFAPGMLWYLGNGYAHTGIMMPVVIVFLMIVLPIFSSPDKISTKRLTGLAITEIILVYFDWMGVVIALATILFLLFRIRNKKRYLWPVVILSVSAILATALIFYQYVSYCGVQGVTDYWKGHFYMRSFANTFQPIYFKAGWLIIHLITMYLPLIILIIFSAFGSLIQKKKIIFSNEEFFFIKIYVCCLLLYNYLFLEWSYEHEFSVVPWSLLLVYVGAKMVIHLFSKRAIFFILTVFFIVSVTQYYFINRPGKISQDGMPFDTFKIFGEQLKQVPNNYMIISPLEKRAPMIEYYAKRNIFIIPTLEEAKKFLIENNIHQAVWVDQQNYQLKKITYLDR